MIENHKQPNIRIYIRHLHQYKHQYIRMRIHIHRHLHQRIYLSLYIPLNLYLYLGLIFSNIYSYSGMYMSTYINIDLHIFMYTYSRFVYILYIWGFSTHVKDNSHKGSDNRNITLRDKTMKDWKPQSTEHLNLQQVHEPNTQY